MSGTIIWIILNAVIIGAVGAGIMLNRHRKALAERQRVALETLEDRMAELADVEDRMEALQERLDHAERTLGAGVREDA